MIQPGDTLGKLARQYLGTAARHPEIAALNPDVAADPKKLRPGQVLRIRCEDAPATGSANVAQASSATTKPGFWARLFGIGQTEDGKPLASGTIETTSIAPEVVRTLPEIPVWRAENGEYLIDVLERWGKAAGYEIVIEDRGDWRFRVPFRVEGPLRLALREVVKGFGSGPSAPLLVVYGNRVVRVGAAR
ncbi:MAG: TcpQ domain-containing protein [Gemmatimonadota bacterium]|nr:TcpQ domain-containing protein [Gemmatimonadota bacterium]